MLRATFQVAGVIAGGIIGAAWLWFMTTLIFCL